MNLSIAPLTPYMGLKPELYVFNHPERKGFAFYFLDFALELTTEKQTRGLFSRAWRKKFLQPPL